MSNIVFHTLFAIGGVLLGAVQGFLLWQLIRYVTGTNPLYSAVFLIVKMMIYVCVFTLVALLAKDGLIAFGAGLGVSIFICGALISVINIKKQ